MPVRLPNRRKTQWDYLLEEMAWMAEDFKQERVWKEAAARGLSLSVLSRPKPNPRKSDSAGATDVEADLKARAKAVSDTVTSHWSQCGNAGPLADDGVKNYAVWAKYKGEEAPEPGNGRKQAPEGEGPVKTLEEAGKALADFGEKASELGWGGGDDDDNDAPDDVDNAVERLTAVEGYGAVLSAGGDRTSKAAAFIRRKAKAGARHLVIAPPASVVKWRCRLEDCKLVGFAGGSYNPQRKDPDRDVVLCELSAMR